jgi:hypothetical protein
MDVKKLSQANAAYLAGLVDGEGTVTLCRKHRNENRQLAVSISNTDKGLLYFVRGAIGAGKITGKRTVRPNHTPSFTYAIYNRQALCLLEQIQPYLHTYKFERSLLILEKYSALTARNGKYSPKQKQARAEFEAAILQITPGSRRLKEST